MVPILVLPPFDCLSELFEGYGPVVVFVAVVIVGIVRTAVVVLLVLLASINKW